MTQSVISRLVGDRIHLKHPNRLRLLLGIVGVIVLASVVSIPLRLAGRAGAAGSAFPGSGPGAFAGWYDASTNVSADVFVTRGGSTSNPETWLGYDMYSCDDQGCQDLQAGYGPIPNSALTGSYVAGLNLKVDTSQVPGFLLYAGSGGPIAVSWQPTKAMTGGYSGSSRFKQRSPRCIFANGGSSRFTSSDVKGTVIGTTITGDYFAQMYDFHGVYISVGKCFD